jgi:hypothetical protein
VRAHFPLCSLAFALSLSPALSKLTATTDDEEFAPCLCGGGGVGYWRNIKFQSVCIESFHLTSRAPSLTLNFFLFRFSHPNNVQKKLKVNKAKAKASADGNKKSLIRRVSEINFLANCPPRCLAVYFAERSRFPWKALNELSQQLTCAR